MTETRTITCINCPMGCELAVRLEAGAVAQVAGNLCKRGIAYARMECTNPTRMLATTVRLRGSGLGQLPVKSAGPVPKDRVLDCVRALKEVELVPPVCIGDVVLANVLGTGVDIVATREVKDERGASHNTYA